jgi:hypothetical protein
MGGIASSSARIGSGNSGAAAWAISSTAAIEIRFDEQRISPSASAPGLLPQVLMKAEVVRL